MVGERSDEAFEVHLNSARSDLHAVVSSSVSHLLLALRKLKAQLTFLLMLFITAWPLIALGNSLEDPWVPNALAMALLALVAFVHSKIFRLKLELWNFKKSKAALLLAILLPIVMYSLSLSLIRLELIVIVLLQTALNMIPAWGEEVAWRSYFYDVLLKDLSKDKRLLIHGLAWWFWHLPMAFSSLEELWAFFLLTPLGVLRANVFLWLYERGGVAVSTFHHALYNAMRDASLIFGSDDPLLAIYSVTILLAVGIMVTRDLLKK